jgi:predicted AAA+ superfamily ATPase
MIGRRLQPIVEEHLRHLPAVALLGPRQAGKTTLAQAIAETGRSIYLDLESHLDREKLADPSFYLSRHEDELVVLDEVQRLPDIFATLRGLIDQGRRRGKKAGRFLLLGSASADLLRQSETLAGRIAYVELSPLDVLEVPASKQTQLWIRGGFPESFLAENNERSRLWRESFVRTYLERDIPQLGPRIPATTLHRFWTMLAHTQGGLFNAAQLARSLSVDGKTVARYLDLMTDLMLVRQLQPYQANVGKRLVKSPKVYVRDSGIVHSLLNIEDHEALLGHPIVGASWEGFAIENIIAAAPRNAVPLFYRTAIGVEIDLVLEIPKQGLWAIEIKHGLSALPGKGFYTACADLGVKRRFVVNAGSERREIDARTEVLGLRAIAQVLAGL